jgi:hypothetical protein
MNKHPKYFYVYIITNIILNKQYVGSRLCYKDNICDDLYWGSSKYLKKDFEIYGKQNFIKKILRNDYINIKDMLDGETEYILKYNTLTPNGYNRFLPNTKNGFHMCGVESPMKNKHHTDESIKKMSKSRLGKKFTENHKSNLSKSIRYVKDNASEEEKQKRHEYCKGEKNGMYGKEPWIKNKHHTQKTIELIKHNTKLAMLRSDVKEKQKQNKPLMYAEKNGMFKKHHTKESKEKISNNIKKVPKIKCLYCLNNYYPWHYSRSHGEKCKNKNNII